MRLLTLLLLIASAAVIGVLPSVGVLPSAPHSLAQAVHAGPDAIYPDPALTPGESFSGVTADQVCQPDWAKRARSVSRTERAAVFRAYGLRDDPGYYELDHFIPLEIGGDNAAANLWPEPFAYPGAHEKDVVENYLHDQVCAGAMDLAGAQAAMAADWYAIYLALLPPASP